MFSIVVFFTPEWAFIFNTSYLHQEWLLSTEAAMFFYSSPDLWWLKLPQVLSHVWKGGWGEGCSAATWHFTTRCHYILHTEPFKIKSCCARRRLHSRFKSTLCSFFSPEPVPVPQFMDPCSRAGPELPAVICPGPAEPPHRSEWWRAAQNMAEAAAAAGWCLSEPRSESPGGPWTCGRWGCGPSQNASRTSGRRTPGRPLPCVWSCGIWVMLAGGTGSRTPHTCRRENVMTPVSVCQTHAPGFIRSA